MLVHARLPTKLIATESKLEFSKAAGIIDGLGELLESLALAGRTRGTNTAPLEVRYS
jgi:hypothetical protein